MRLRAALRALLLTAAIATACRENSAGPKTPPFVLRASAASDSLLWGRTMSVQLAIEGDTTPVVMSDVVWTSADTNVATVDSTGTILAVGVGSTTVTALYRTVRTTLPMRGVLLRADGGVVFTAGSRNESQMCALASGVVYCRARPTAADSAPKFLSKPGANGLEFTAVESSQHAACALERGGQLYCWGTNAHFIFGRSIVIATDTGPYAIPAPVRFSRFTHGGHAQTCAVARTDSVTYCWGHNDAYQIMHDRLRVEDTVIAPISGNLRAMDVSTANFSTCLLDLTGLPYCAGSLSVARSSLGIDASNEPAAIGMPVATSLRFASITTGDQFQCALTAAGAAYCWGVNNDGQLGNGTTATVLPSFPAPVLGSVVFRALHAVYPNGMCGISTTNDLYCWGAGVPAKLRARPGMNAAKPTALLRGLKFTDLTEDVGRLCGITTDGKALCW